MSITQVNGLRWAVDGTVYLDITGVTLAPTDTVHADLMDKYGGTVYGTLLSTGNNPLASISAQRITLKFPGEYTDGLTAVTRTQATVKLFSTVIVTGSDTVDKLAVDLQLNFTNSYRG